MASSSRLGLVRCEHCNRQFNPHSAARHIPWCGNKQQSETRKPRLTSEKQQALDRYRWRISYRPTNYLGRSNHQSGSNRQDSSKTKNKHNSSSNSNFFNHPPNGSSVFSSPASSASTSTSFGSQSNNNHSNHSTGANQLHQYRRQVQQQHRPAAQLTRSVSSITLTKQHQQQHRQRTVNNRNNQPHRQLADTQSIASTASDLAAGRSRQTPNRAKSHCDFTNISEIVDVLTRRMDEIYAQNKRLLADLTKSSGASRPSSRCGALMNSSSTSSVANYDPDELFCVRCHHCKTDCLDGANYCHRCGCKLAQPRSVATPDSESQAQACRDESDCAAACNDDGSGGGIAS